MVTRYLMLKYPMMFEVRWLSYMTLQAKQRSACFSGNLYEYDQRNGELSVVLERVTAFEFSADKRFIAYKLQDEDIIYVGKMQGRNVLYNEPVYHSILPLNMKWSPDNTSLFMQGSKIYANPNIVPNDVSVEEPVFIIEFE